MDVKILPILAEVVFACEKHLSDTFYGNLAFSLDFQKGKAYKVKNIYGEQLISMDEIRREMMEKLK
jgi:hypothetical protein